MAAAATRWPKNRKRRREDIAGSLPERRPTVNLNLRPQKPQPWTGCSKR
jgi:hypothetical protein